MLSVVKDFYNLHYRKPTILENLFLPKEGVDSFVCAVGYTYNGNHPNAMTVARNGYVNAFLSLGYNSGFVSTFDLYRVLKSSGNETIVMLFWNDLMSLSDETVELLSKKRVIIWVNPWFEGDDEWFRKRDLDPSKWRIGKRIKLRISRINPRFVFSATTASGLEFYSAWEEQLGLKAVSLPLACDDTIYYADKTTLFPDIDVAFVGGYWQSKGVELDRYLRTFESKLTVYGYNQWPYVGYKGKITVEQERCLYTQAAISPAINEPSVKYLNGQINERVFKVLGCEGCSVVDEVTGYGELFSDSELIMSKNPRDFMLKAELLLKDRDMNKEFREKGFEAVRTRHTYSHRAQTIIELLDGKSKRRT